MTWSSFLHHLTGRGQAQLGRVAALEVVYRHGPMTSIWLESLGRNFDNALDLFVAAIRNCPDALWEVPMWPVPAWDPNFGLVSPEGQPVTEPADRLALVQRHSTPWAVAWHALECLDYDLTGEFAPWNPPAPFAGHPHWLLTGMPKAWSRAEMLAYVDYCRERVRHTLAAMTDEKGATPLPQPHRYQGQPHAWIVTGMVGHTIEHAAQIQQFVTDATVNQKADRRGSEGRS